MLLVCSNVYPRELRVAMREAGWAMVRYAGDTVVQCRTRDEAKLALHPHKTHLGDCRVDDQGFEFLGY